MGRQIASEQPASEQNAQYGPVFSDDELKNTRLSGDLAENLKHVRKVVGQNVDIVIREFLIPLDRDYRAAMVFLDDQVDDQSINRDILRPLMLDLPSLLRNRQEHPRDLLEFLVNRVLAITEVKIYDDFDRLIMCALSGCVVLLVDGENRFITVNLQKFPHRNVPETETENSVRGPKEAFTEVIAINIAMLRHKMREPNLVIESMTVGTRTRTALVVAYVRGLANPELVTEVKKRLNRIKIDSVLESGYLEEFLQDNPYTPFPLIGNTERPDRVASLLLEGRVAVFTDGTPFVIWMPARMADLLQTPEDFYQNYYFGTALRWLRFTGLVISLMLPSFYVAVTTFHQEMIPSGLLLRISAGREGVPFPVVVEALVMEATFEALREAGIRLPRAIGQAVSIVGALVIGQAAVAAGIVSPIMVIVVAVTGIASFMGASYSLGIAVRMLRFPLMLFSAALGFFGLMTGLLLILIHLLTLRSFGVPYMGPLAPANSSELKDVLVRAPWWTMNKRPGEYVKDNRVRQSPGLKPRPPRR